MCGLDFETSVDAISAGSFEFQALAERRVLSEVLLQKRDRLSNFKTKNE